MENEVSILFLEHSDKKLFDEDTVDNLNLKYIFNDDLIETLIYSCTLEEALERQKVFKEMLYGSMLNFFEYLSTLLVRLERLITNYELNKPKISKLIISYNICDTYVKIYDTIINCGINIKFIAKIKEYLSKYKDIVEKMRVKLIECASSIDNISNNNFLVRGSVVEGFVGGQGKSDSLSEQLIKLVEKFGIDFSMPEDNCNYKDINIHLSDTVLSYYKDDEQALSCFGEFIAQLNFDILVLRSQISFYQGIYYFTKKAIENNITLCFPNFSEKMEFTAKDAFDITMLGKREIIPNDIYYRENIKQFFLIGINGGGKTTYLRTVAVNLILALTGCPVFCKEMSVYFFKSIYTHFPVETENSLSAGRLEEETQRLNGIIEQISSDSFIFLNETYSSTNDFKGTSMSLELAEKVRQKDASMLFVTHFINVIESDFPFLATQGADNEGNNSFKIIDHILPNTSFSEGIISKYGLSKNMLESRFGVKWE